MATTTTTTLIAQTAASSATTPTSHVVDVAKRAAERGYSLLRNVMRSPRCIMAPMVDQSELAWRLLGRRYGCDVCYSPMLHARLFHEDSRYRADVFSTCAEDRPLVVQFCANDPGHLLAAATLIQDRCDAVDINLGCPQGIARRGHYGSFLQDDWDCVASLVRTLSTGLTIPVTCKIRIFPDVTRTVAYAQMLQNNGCCLLTVHGRIRSQKGALTGLADWQQIQAVKRAVTIPVFANGNVCYNTDVDRVLTATGCDAVMASEAQLYNPALFSGRYPAAHRLASEYLDIVEQIPNSAHLGAIKGHIFKVLHSTLRVFPEFREELSRSRSVEQFRDVVNRVAIRVRSELSSDDEFIPNPEQLTSGKRLDIPSWAAQPYIRDEYIYDETKYRFNPNFIEASKRPRRDSESSDVDHKPPPSTDDTECIDCNADESNVPLNNDTLEKCSNMVLPGVIDTTLEDEGKGTPPTKRQMKKFQRYQRRMESLGKEMNKTADQFSQRSNRDACSLCKANVAAIRCEFHHCKECCRKRFDTEHRETLKRLAKEWENSGNATLPEGHHIVEGLLIDRNELLKQGICVEHLKFLVRKLESPIAHPS